MDPIRFEFTFDEASFLRYERMSKMGGETGENGMRGAKIPVSLKLIDEKDFPHQGTMDFVDNMIDRATGTIRGRAVFANPNGIFTPGMFARVRVAGSAPYDALLVPDAAVGTEQARKFVLTVNADNTVVAKYVTLGQVTNDDLRVIKDGLSADDHVIVDGLLRARPGQKVTPQEQGAKPGGGTAAPQAAK